MREDLDAWLRAADGRSRTSYGYWLLVEHRPAPRKRLRLQDMVEWMTFHYDVEEKASSAKQLRGTDRRWKWLQPVAPVTLTMDWTPFGLCEEMLGEPEFTERGNGLYEGAMAIWRPKGLQNPEPEDRSKHGRHFAFLLRLAHQLAEQAKGRIVLVANQGWSYSSWKDESYMMNPKAALTLMQAGYLFPDRIRQ